MMPIFRSVAKWKSKASPLAFAPLLNHYIFATVHSVRFDLEFVLESCDDITKKWRRKHSCAIYKIKGGCIPNSENRELGNWVKLWRHQIYGQIYDVIIKLNVNKMLESNQNISNQTKLKQQQVNKILLKVKTPEIRKLRKN